MNETPHRYYNFIFCVSIFRASKEKYMIFFSSIVDIDNVLEI